ncbi:MAG: ABC transporter permease [Clostridia bacterium]|nr:ABC transporter permease [Clostridia bacterium]
MRKYLYIYKATLIENLQYISNIILGMISFFVTIFVFLNLWDYMYADSSELINGYNINQMVWYVLIGEILWYGTRNKTLTNEISNDIKSGNIAYNINKPYNYVFYIISKHFGEITIKFITFILIGSVIGRIFVGKIIGFSLVSIPFIMIVVLLGVFINSIIRIAISVISFWIEDSNPFHWVYDKFILIFGTIFPIEMFPKILQSAMIFSPIFVVNYGPAKLIINFTFEKFIQIFIVQIIYIVILVLLLLLLYNKGVRKLNVNGG